MLKIQLVQKRITAKKKRLRIFGFNDIFLVYLSLSPKTSTDWC